MIEVEMKLFKAIIWSSDPGVPGCRVSVVAADLAEAKRQLEAEHGEGRVFDLHNEQEAARTR